MKKSLQERIIIQISITSIRLSMSSYSKNFKTPSKHPSHHGIGVHVIKPTSIAHKQEELKKIDAQQITSTCIDVLHAMLHSTEKDAERCISRIKNQDLRLKFLTFMQDYYYKLFRQGNLKVKVSELNDFFKEIATSKQLILPTIKLKTDEIKELDYPSLQRVIKMTNQSKIFTQIMKKEEIKLNIDYFNTESLANFNSLIKMQYDNFEDVKALKAKFDQLQSDHRVLRMKMYKKSSQSQKEQKEILSPELASNREVIAKLKADVDRLTKENQRLNEIKAKQPSNFLEKLNYRRNPIQDQRQRARRQKQMKAQLQRQYQQILAQKQRRIKQLTDNSKVTKIMLDQIRVDRDQAKGISQVLQIQFQQLNEKYQKMLREAKEKEQKYEEQRLVQAQMNIVHSSEMHELEQQLRSKDQQLAKASKKLQQKQKSDSEEKNKWNQQLIQNQNDALMKYKQLKQEKQRNQRTLQESSKFLRQQLQEKSATLLTKKEELKDTKISFDTLRKDNEIVNKQLGELKDRQNQEQKANRVYQERVNNLESLVKKLESTIKEKEDSLDKEKRLSRQLSDSLDQVRKEHQLLKKELTNYQQRLEKYDSISAQKQKQDEHYNKLKEALKQKEQQIARSNASVKEIQRQLLRSKEIVARLEASISALENQKQQAKKQINEKDIHISELSAKIMQLQLFLGQSEKKNRKLEKDIEEVNNQNISYLLNIQNVQDQNKNLESKCNVLEKKLKTQQTPPQQQEEERFEVLKEQPEPKQEESNHMQQKQYLERQIQQKQAQIEKAKEECKKTEKELQLLEQYYARESNKSKQLENKANELQSSLKDCEQQLKDKSQVLNDVLKQLDQHKERDRIRMSKQLDDMKELRDKQSITKQLQSQLQQQKKLLAIKEHELSQQTLSHQNEIQEIKQEMGKVQARNQELIERIAQLSKEKKSLEVKRTEQQLAQEEGRKQMEILQAQLNNCQRKSQQIQQILRDKDQQLEKLYKEQYQSNKIIQQYKEKQAQISSTNTQISDLQLKLLKFQAESEKLTLSLKQSQTENNSKRIKINQLQYQNDNFQFTLRKMNEELDNSKRHIKDIIKEQENVLDKEKKKHSFDMQKVSEEIDLLTKKNKELEELFEKLTESNERIESQLIKKESQLQAEKSASSKLRHEIAEFYTEKKKPALSSDERTKFQKKIKSYEEEIADLNHQLEILHLSIEDMNSMNRSFENRSEVEVVSKESLQKLRVLEEEIAKKDEYFRRQSVRWKEEKSKLDAKIDECHAQIDELKEKNKILEESCQNLTQETQAIKLEMTKISMTLDLKTKEFSTLQQSHDLLIAQQREYIQQTEHERLNYDKQLNSIKKHCQEILKAKDLSASLLFQNDLLEYELQYKIFLKQAIQNHMRLDIARTRLIYRFDPMNKTNFHKYFDNKDNIVIIVKTIYGSYIAGYSQGPFAPKRVSDRDGLIIALNKKEVFTLSQNCTRAITYDDYYLIFGNSEVRLRSQQQKVFSNFAISNGYYATRGKKVMDLLGGGPSEREVEIEGYEIYQLEFVY